VILPEFRDDETSPWSKIIYNENTNERMIDSLLLFKVQDQTDGVMVVNWLPQEQHLMCA